MRYLLILSLLISCASKKDESVPAEVKSFKNEDFKSKKPVVYSKKRDINKFSDTKVAQKSSLSAESLQKNNLFEDVSGDDKLTDLSRTCYNKDFDEAINQIKSMQEIYKTNVMYWNQVGSCYLLKREYRKALLFYNKGLEISPSYSPILNNIGVMYELKGEDGRALVAYKKARTQDKYARTPKYNLGQLYLRYGFYERAKGIFTGLYRLQSKDVDLVSALATIELMQGNFKRADAYYRQLDSDEREKPEIGMNYALNLFRMGKSEEAKDALSDIDISEESTLYQEYKRIRTIIRRQ